MARPLRIEFPGALYHITSRGNDGNPIYCDDVDRRHFLEKLTRGCNRYSWLCHAYCLMTNHYHLLVETQQPTLSKGMKYLTEATHNISINAMLEQDTYSRADSSQFWWTAMPTFWNWLDISF
jgi:REP element-mobilizing transposase RayT